MLKTIAITRVSRLFRRVFNLPSLAIECVYSTWKIRRSEGVASIEPYPDGSKGMCAGWTILWLKKSIATSNPAGIRKFDDLGKNPPFEASVIEGAHVMDAKINFTTHNIRSIDEIHVDFTTLINDLDLLLFSQGMEYWDSIGGQGMFNPLHVAHWATLQPGHCLLSYARKSGFGHVIGIRRGTYVQIFDTHMRGLIESINTPVYAVRAYLQMMIEENDVEDFQGCWAVVRVRSSVN